MPRPFSSAASGSSSGSAYGASQRTATWAAPTRIANARPYSNRPAGILPFSPSPTFAYASRTTPTTKMSMSSSVRRRPRGTGTGSAWLPGPAPASVPRGWSDGVAIALKNYLPFRRGGPRDWAVRREGGLRRLDVRRDDLVLDLGLDRF